MVRLLDDPCPDEPEEPFFEEEEDEDEDEDELEMEPGCYGLISGLVS